jgi:hypothetical protein
VIVSGAVCPEKAGVASSILAPGTFRTSADVASPMLYTPYSPDGESRLYRIELKQLIALAEQRITRTFTPWERRRYLHQPDA